MAEFCLACLNRLSGTSYTEADFLLSREPEHPTIALCYDFQMVEHLETNQFDHPADRVLWA